MPDTEKSIDDLANVVAEEYESAVILYSGPIWDEGYGKLFEALHLPEGKQRETGVLLLLATNGGSPAAAYQCARLLQFAYEKFYVCVPRVCRSAGTLMALGADEIIMTEIAELGPLDIQVPQKDEIGERRSGLVVQAALRGLAEETTKVYEQVMLDIKSKSGGIVSFEVASRIAAKIAVGIMQPVYQPNQPYDPRY